MRRTLLSLAPLLLLAACETGGPNPGPSASASAAVKPAPSPTPTSRFQVFKPLAGPSALAGLAVTGDGSAWFTEVNRNAVGRILPDGSYQEYALPQPDRQPQGIAAGPDGGVWFAEEAYGIDQVGHISLAGKLTEYGNGITSTSQPWRIAAGPDGNMWFTEIGQQPPLTNRVGRITPSGRVTEFVARLPDEITKGPDGAMWFTSGSDQLGRISTGGAISYRPYKAGVLQGIAAGPDGAIWAITDSVPASGATISRVTTSGAETDFTAAGPARALDCIAAGPDGALWFGDPDLGSLGRVTPDGTVTEYALQTGMVPGLIAAGVGQTLWVGLTDGRLVKVSLPLG